MDTPRWTSVKTASGQNKVWQQLWCGTALEDQESIKRAHSKYLLVNVLEKFSISRFEFIKSKVQSVLFGKGDLKKKHGIPMGVLPNPDHTNFDR